MDNNKNPINIAQALPKKPLVLIGLMGAGKSTIGKKLAQKIGREFMDADDEIEHAAGCSIADIFAIHGEAIFRDLELRVIKRLMQTENTVVATGGGAWMQPEIRSDIQKNAISIWLRAPLNVLYNRVKERNHRPLLEAGNKREILARLIETRYPVYESADIIIDSSHGSREKIVIDILERLQSV